MKKALTILLILLIAGMVNAENYPESFSQTCEDFVIIQGESLNKPLGNALLGTSYKHATGWIPWLTTDEQTENPFPPTDVKYAVCPNKEGASRAMSPTAIILHPKTTLQRDEQTYAAIADEIKGCAYMQIYVRYPTQRPYWNVLGTNTKQHENIIAYKIWNDQYDITRPLATNILQEPLNSNKWSQWYIPGENDAHTGVTYKDQEELKWGLFKNYPHVIAVCEDKEQFEKILEAETVFVNTYPYTGHTKIWKEPEYVFNANFPEEFSDCKDWGVLEQSALRTNYWDGVGTDRERHPEIMGYRFKEGYFWQEEWIQVGINDDKGELGRTGNPILAWSGFKNQDHQIAICEKDIPKEQLQEVVTTKKSSNSFFTRLITKIKQLFN